MFIITSLIPSLAWCRQRTAWSRPWGSLCCSDNEMAASVQRRISSRSASVRCSGRCTWGTTWGRSTRARSAAGHYISPSSTHVSRTHLQQLGASSIIGLKLSVRKIGTLVFTNSTQSKHESYVSTHIDFHSWLLEDSRFGARRAPENKNVFWAEKVGRPCRLSYSEAASESCNRLRRRHKTKWISI